MSNEIHKSGDTYRTLCGNGRATFHPEWSTEKPWVCYVRGTATIHAATIQSAASYFLANKMTLETEKE
jgi:hypothetical protein